MKCLKRVALSPILISHFITKLSFPVKASCYLISFIKQLNFEIDLGAEVKFILEKKWKKIIRQCFSRIHKHGIWMPLTRSKNKVDFGVM